MRTLTNSVPTNIREYASLLNRLWAWSWLRIDGYTDDGKVHFKASGRHPHYVNSYLHEGKLRFSAIWGAKPEMSGLIARHGLMAEQFLTSWEDAMSAGFRTRTITGCEEGVIGFHTQSIGLSRGLS
jgi:hypothetical protein